MSSGADAGQRLAAIDPAQSCIVEAPAGSGKTELLTQRFLRLLSLVDEPEQVVAITFTRKAAAEMRLRVLETLQLAADAGTVAPHRQTSLRFAAEVLERSGRLGWSLLELSERLQIQTIDSLNARLARQLPVLTSGLAGVEVTDQADSLYRLAARRTAEALGDDDTTGAGLRHLLETADNSLAQLENWLSDILPQRDRWLRLLENADAAALPAAMEGRLRRLTDGHCEALSRLAGPAIETRLSVLLEQTDAGCIGGTPTASWIAAANLLLTGTGTWRQRFTRREGVPPEAKELRARLLDLQQVLRDIPGMLPALTAVRQLPPAVSGSRQRRSLEALCPVLTRLFAELRLAFIEARTVDHPELALGALEALGAVGAPSDLLLALDRRIEHILVDEFQDTSHLQWEILARLTAGWEAGDGRSLFLVGDPMQSIYRFRDADIALFSRARDTGIGEIRLRHLRLSTNYRSAPELVERINTVFENLYGAGPDGPAIGPSFGTAIAGRDPDPTAGLELHELHAGLQADENRRVVEIARAELLAHSESSIGILVRSRSHLRGLRQALAEAGLAAHAVEIDSLSDTPLGQDLLAFISALLHPADRLAWLGLLRGPCCGIGWRDLSVLCERDRERSIPELLRDHDLLKGLSEDGSRRVHWLLRALSGAERLRETRSVGRWLQACWELIDGFGVYSDRSDRQQAAACFSQLDRLARHGDIDDPGQLQALFSRPDGSQTPAASGIEVMTIHRAKGLEFDTVILPGLSRSSRGNISNLLYIRDIYTPAGGHLTLAAVHEEPADPLMNFLQQQDREQELAERARLLYVAMTRARQRLHLIAAVDSNQPQPRAGSLLATLWPARGELPPSARQSHPVVEVEVPEFIELPLRRYSISHVADSSVDTPQTRPLPALRPEFEWVNPASVQVGTVIHRELHQLSRRAALAGVPVPPTIEDERYRRELSLLGVEVADLRDAARRVSDALTEVWEDPIGRWILAPHPEAWSEQRLTIRIGSMLEHIRLDRSFVDEEGQRWIIDYKTGRHLGADVEAFLAAEVERYREQLERYAAAVAAFELRPIRVGLYFPLMRRLMDWLPEAVARDQSVPV